MINWVAVAVALVPGYFFQVFMHEGAHALILLMHGGKVRSFNIFPHQANGRFYFGRVTYENYDQIDNTGRALISFAPIMFGSPFFILYGFLAWIFATKGWSIAASVLLVMHVMAGVDIGRGFLNRYIGGEHHDINKTFKYARTPTVVRDHIPWILAATILCCMVAVFIGVLLVG